MKLRDNSGLRGDVFQEIINAKFEGKSTTDATDAIFDAVDRALASPSPKTGGAPAPPWTKEEIARAKVAADGYGDVFPDPAVPAAEPCPSCGGNHGPIDPAYLHPTDHRIIHPTPVNGCMYCPAPEPVKPPVTWDRCVKHGDEMHLAHEYDPGTAARWALQDNIGRCPAFAPARTPAAGTAEPGEPPESVFCDQFEEDIPGFGTNRDTHRCAKAHRSRRATPEKGGR